MSDDTEPLPVEPASDLLQYAPPVRSAGWHRPFIVLLAGLSTSAIAVALVYMLYRFQHADPFGWQLMYLIPIGIPIGAILIALVASSGYWIAARFTHVRPGRALTWAIILLTVATYGAGMYIEFAPFHWVNRRTHRPLSFVEYVQINATSWTWKSYGEVQHLGEFGYVYLVLNAGAFALVGAIAPRIGRGTPRCDLCRVYLTSRRLALFPASLPYRKLDGMNSEDRAAFQAEQLEQTRDAIDGAALLFTIAEAGDVEALRQVIDGVRADRRAVARLPTRIELSMETCPGCRATALRTTLLIGKTSRALDHRTVSGAFADLLQPRTTSA